MMKNGLGSLESLTKPKWAKINTLQKIQTFVQY